MSMFIYWRVSNVLASIVSKMDRMCTKFHCMPLTCRLRMLGAKKQYNLLG